MDELHSLLKRQLQRFTVGNGSPSEEQTDLLRAVNEAYWQFDADRRLLEHRLELTSRELLEKNAELTRINADLEQRVAERTVSLRSSLNFGHALYQVAQSASTLENLPEVLQSVADTVTQTLAADRTSVITFDHDAAQVNYVARAGQGAESVIQTVSYNELMDGLSGWALRELRTAFSPKGKPDPRESPAAQQRRNETNCGCIVVVPLLSMGESLGTITVINRVDQPDFTQQEVAWLEAIANQAAIAIGRAQIYDQLKKANVLLGQQSERLQRQLIDREHAEVALAAERDLLQALMDNIPDTIYFKDTASRFIRINHAQMSVLGITAPEDAIGKTDLDFQDSDLAKGFYEEEQRIINTGEPLINRLEFNPTPDGKPRWFSATKVPLKDSDGRVIGLAGISRNVTEQKQAENGLHQSEEKFRSLVERLPAITYISAFDKAKTRLYVSPQNETYLGFTPAEWLADPDLWRNQLHPRDRDRVLAEAAHFYESGEPFISEYCTLNRQGEPVWFHDEAVIVRDANGQSQFIQGVKINITERKLAEDALQQNQERLRLMVWATIDAVWDWDLTTNQIWWGAGLQKIFQYAPEITQTDKAWWLSHIHPEDRDKVHRAITAALEGGLDFWSKEYRFQRVDSTFANIMDRGYILRDEAGKPYRMIGALMDITERKQAEQALLESEARYRQIVETAGDIIYGVDLHGHLKYVNPTAMRIMKYNSEDQILGRHYLEFVHPAWRGRVKYAYSRQFSEKTLNTYEEVLAVTRERQEIWLGQTVQLVMENNRVTGFQAVARDITSQKQAEAALHDLNGKMAQSLSQLQRRNHEIVLLNELSRLLQACQSTQEAYRIIAELMDELFPRTSGALYLLNPSRTVATALSSWGNLPAAERRFAPDDCWALRRGLTQLLREDQAEPRCLHLSDPPPEVSYCLTIHAQNEILGVLHVQSMDRGNLDELKRQLAYTVVEQTGMALSNLRLRDALREQSIRDPLTGLYNRRYMEEALKQHLSRVTRQLHPLGIIMLDIDHFKLINDTYGHSAGDALLAELGRLLKGHIRSEDIACRYGGEEFIVIMPDASLEATQVRAEHLRQAAKTLRVQDGGASDGRITLSLGVAVYPQHGRNMDRVLRAADDALYEAKRAGRDQIVCALPRG